MTFGIRRSGSLIVLLVALSSTLAWAGPYEECLLRAIADGRDELTIGELKERCRAAQPAAATAEATAAADSDTVPTTHVDHFSVTPHKQNYILLFSHNTTPNTTPYHDTSMRRIDHDEITFQVSLKFPLLSFQLGDKKTYLMAAYTAKSFWQAYNKTLSSPFRETNHEPEIFAVYPLDLKIAGVRRAYLMAGFVHQSNGRSQPLSRSWNRFFADFVVEGDNFKLSVKPWYRIPEENNDLIGVSASDDNPDINDYLGYGEISGAVKVDSHTLSFMLRNNLDFHDNKGAIQLGWSFKIPYIESDNLKGYIHYFNGYGESLIDYDAAVERIGIGLMLADWL